MIKIHVHKHAKGTSKEFPKTQGSKIQDVTGYTQDKYESLDKDIDFVSEDESKIGEHGVGNDVENDKPLAPKPRHVNEELGPEEDVDDWLKTEIEKHMCRQDKESEEDKLIDILKSIVEE
ncbi:hypothetical protein Tco_0076863 [Tanacetum coccineum]